MKVYLDNAATTPMAPEVIELMTKVIILAIRLLFILSAEMLKPLLRLQDVRLLKSSMLSQKKSSSLLVEQKRITWQLLVQ
jgi:hypothetical protein